MFDICTYPYGLSLNLWHALLCIPNNRHGVTITTYAIKRHFLIWMTTVRQPTKRRRSCVLTLKYTFICVYWWTRQWIHSTLIAVDRYLRLMGDKTIPDSAESRLKSFYPPWVTGIDLPHQDVVDSYNLSLLLFLLLAQNSSIVLCPEKYSVDRIQKHVYLHGLTDIIIWINNFIRCFLWDMISHPYHNFDVMDK